MKINNTITNMNKSSAVRIKSVQEQITAAQVKLQQNVVSKESPAYQVTAHIPELYSDLSYSITYDKRMLMNQRSANVSESDSAAIKVKEAELNRTYNDYSQTQTVYDKYYKQSVTYKARTADAEIASLGSSGDAESFVTAGIWQSSYDTSARTQTKDFMSSFRDSAEYQNAAKNGISNWGQAAQLSAAADYYKWQYAYKKNDVYADDMYQFADALKAKSGVYVTTRDLNSYESADTVGVTWSKLSFDDSNSLCTTDNYTFQFMARHQDQMDLWSDVVSGKYNNFDEIGKAIEKTGDTSLISDWKSNMEENTAKADFLSTNFMATSKYVSLDAPDIYSKKSESDQVKDWWSEFNYNVGGTDKFEFTGRFSYASSEHNKVEQSFDIAGEAVAVRKQSKNSDSSSDMTTHLREQIKDIRQRSAALQNGKLPDEDSQRQIDNYQKQIVSIEEQITTIEADKLLREKQSVNA